MKDETDNRLPLAVTDHKGAPETVVVYWRISDKSETSIRADKPRARILPGDEDGLSHMYSSMRYIPGLVPRFSRAITYISPGNKRRRFPR